MEKTLYYRDGSEVRIGDGVRVSPVESNEISVDGVLVEVIEDRFTIKKNDGTLAWFSFGAHWFLDKIHDAEPTYLTKEQILDKAKSIISGERQGTYGHAENSFAVIAQMWTAYLGKDLTSADVANMMILMKVARNSSGVYKDDNWVDICGYAALGGEIQGMYE